MIRKKKKFSWPRKLWDKPRIIEENVLKERYGLKNKREIWKTDAKINYFRGRAKSLITAEQDEQKKFFGNLNKIGLKVETISDVLALNKEALLKRRLSSVLVAKKIANTPKQARQMITHRKIMVDGLVVNIPSYIVKVSEEKSIRVREVKKVKPKPVPVEDKVEETNEAKEKVLEEKGEVKE